MTVQTEGYSTAHDFAHVARVMEYYWINRGDIKIRVLLVHESCAFWM